VSKGLLLAYHDRSDGGAVVALAEMAITGGRGVKAALPGACAHVRRIDFRTEDHRAGKAGEDSPPSRGQHPELGDGSSMSHP